MARLVLIQGPAGGGKSAVARAMLDGGEVRILADNTRLWAAIRDVRRGPDGRFPERNSEADALDALLAAYVKRVVVRQALGRNLDTAVTTSVAGEAPTYAGIAAEFGSEFEVRTVDPGEAEVERRLSRRGRLSGQCLRAIGRWYRGGRR
ncbi:MAG: hypothetical protein OXI45_13640 [Acidobacteriota bacterium]|nr:hypothetical protein [Acidobacteriota bacterium]